MSGAIESEEAPGPWSDIFVGRLGLYTLILNLGMLVFAINHFVVATIMPTVVDDLGGLGYYAWAFSLFAVGSIVGAASAGPVSDTYGMRPVYAGAGLVLAAGLAGTALAWDMQSFVAFRFVQGLGGGAVASLAYGLVAALYPANLRGRVLGLVSGIWGFGTLFGPALGGFFAAPGLWRGAFWTMMVLAILFAFLAWRYVDGTSGHGRLRDVPFWRLFMLAAAVVLMSATSVTDANWLRLALFAAALIITAAAFHRDSRSLNNMFPRRITAIGTELGAGYWVLFLVSIVITFVNTYATLFLQVLHGVEPLIAGFLLAVQSFTWTIAALCLTGVKRAREPGLLAAGCLCILIAEIVIVLTVASGPVYIIAIAIAVSGTGMGLLNIPAMQRVIAAVPENEKQSAGTSVQTVRNIGISFGAAASGMIAAMAGLVDGASAAVVAHAMTWVYGVNIVIAVLALLAVIPFFRKAEPG